MKKILINVAHFSMLYLLFFSHTSSSQEIEEVVVQAEVSDDAPIDDLSSISVLSGDKLADAGIENVEDAAAYVPNLVLTETETGNNIVIRGIGAGVNQGFDQSVGLFSDGVPLPRSNMARAPFLDLASLQIKRGPQYVKDGNYAIAGSVHMISNLSTDEFKSGLDINYTPEQKDRTILWTIGGPITDSLSANLVLQDKVSEGYVFNQAKGRLEKQRDETMARVVLGYRASESLNFKLKLEAGSFDTVGRTAEILLDLPSEFPGVTRQVSNNPDVDPVTRDAADSDIAAGWVIESDFINAPLNINYAARLDQTVRENIDAFGSDGVLTTYWAAGQSFTGKINSLYELQNTNYPDLVPSGGISAPQGLLDTELDFNRSTDFEEFSKNDSVNITLGTEFWYGEHQFKLTNSYIDYSFEESQDLDFTPANLFAGQQGEEYEQIFNSLVWQSPQDRRLQLEAGIWHLKSKLRFDNFVFVPFTDRSDRFEGGTPLPPVAIGDEITQDVVNFFPTLEGTFGDVDSPLGLPDLSALPDPARSYYGGQAGDGGGPLKVLALDTFGIDTLFDQDQDLYAAYFQSTMNWTDRLRTTLGIRYTKSRKEATRDTALARRQDRSLITDEDLDIGPDDANQVTPTEQVAETAVLVWARVFGIQLHSCRYSQAALDDLKVASDGTADDCLGDLDGENGVILPSVREKTRILPSFTVEYDLTPDFIGRASARMASKLGGFDAQSFTRPDVRPLVGVPQGTWEFEDEKALTFELGFTWYKPSGFGEMRATAFYTDYEDLQLSRSDGKSGLNVDNAGAAINYGVEIEGNLLLTEAFTIDYSVAWTQFEFTDFKFGTCHQGRRPDYYFVPASVVNSAPDFFSGGTEPLFTLDGQAPQLGFIPVNYDVFIVGQNLATAQGAINTLVSSSFTTQEFDSGESIIRADPAGRYDNNQGFDSYTNPLALPGFCDFKGQTNQYVADWEGSFTFKYIFERPNSITVTPSVDVLYNSGYHTSASQDPLVYQDGFFQLNGRLELASSEEIWTVAMTIQNATDEKIVTYANDTPVGSRFQGARGFVGFSRPPRSIGVNFRYNFY